MIGNYTLVLTADSDGTLNKTFAEIETALKSGMIVTIFSEYDDGGLNCSMTFVKNTLRKSGVSEFCVGTIDKIDFKTTSETGYPRISN